MSNPFSGIITQGMKDLHKNMIDACLENDALSVKCTLIFRGSKWTDAGSFSVDPIGGKPAGAFPHGGPMFRPDGSDVKMNEQTVDLYLGLIWDSKNWIKTPLASTLVNTGDMYVQSISKISTIQQITQCDAMIAGSDIATAVRHTVTRAGEPEPIGYGALTHIITMWKI